MHFELLYQAPCLQLSNTLEILSPAAKLSACFLIL